MKLPAPPSSFDPRQSPEQFGEQLARRAARTLEEGPGPGVERSPAAETAILRHAAWALARRLIPWRRAAMRTGKSARMEQSDQPSVADRFVSVVEAYFGHAGFAPGAHQGRGIIGPGRSCRVFSRMSENGRSRAPGKRRDGAGICDSLQSPIERNLPWAPRPSLDAWEFGFSLLTPPARADIFPGDCPVTRIVRDAFRHHRGPHVIGSVPAGRQPGAVAGGAESVPSGSGGYR